MLLFERRINMPIPLVKLIVLFVIELELLEEKREIPVSDPS
jgi:hypothetical protein